MNREKYVDESWKESIAQEKELLKKTTTTEQNEQPVFEQEQSTPQQAGPTQSDVPQEHEDSFEKSEYEEMEINFLNYITSLIFQTMIFLGEIPNPVAGNRIDKNLKQAKFLIDTLVMIRDKTKGNLTAEEENMLNASIYELQMKYVEAMRQDEQHP